MFFNRMSAGLTLPGAKVAVVLLACIAATRVSAVTEPFSYPNGQLVGQGGGTGWAGPWEAGPTASDPGNIYTLGTDPFKVEGGQMLLDVSDTAIYEYADADLKRSFASPVAAPSVYISLEITPQDMGNVIRDPQFGLIDTGQAALSIAFADGPGTIDIAGPMFTVYEYFQPYGLFGPTYYSRIATSLDGVYAEQSATVVNWTAGNTYRVVGRLDFDPAGDEVWSVWVDPADESSTPQVVKTADLGYESLAMAQMYHFVYNYENTQDPTFDNLRIGTSWQSVIGIPGDTDNDGDIDDSDLGTAFSNYTGPLAFGTGGKTATDGDTDGDGDVDDSDLGTAFAGYTGPLAVNVPEPASLSLLAWMLVGWTRRRYGRRLSRPVTR